MAHNFVYFSYITHSMLIEYLLNNYISLMHAVREWKFRFSVLFNYSLRCSYSQLLPKQYTLMWLTEQVCFDIVESRRWVFVSPIPDINKNLKCRIVQNLWKCKQKSLRFQLLSILSIQLLLATDKKPISMQWKDANWKSILEAWFNSR